MKIPFSVFIVMVVIYSLTVDSKSVLKTNKLRQNRNQALKEGFPDSDLNKLRELQKSLKKTMASLLQIFSKDRRLQRTVRVKNINRGVPFSSWAG